MTETEWRDVIENEIRVTGRTIAGSEIAIGTLAGMLAKRDAALDEWERSGACLLVVKRSDRGSSNLVIHPLREYASRLDRDALAYIRALGLTPGKRTETTKRAGIMDLVRELEDDVETD